MPEKRETMERLTNWFLRVGLMILAFCIILLTIPYWIYISDNNDETVSIIVFTITAVGFIIIGIIGIVIAILGIKNFIVVYGMIMASFFVITVVQLIIVIISIADCDDDEESVIQLFCNRDVADGLYYFQACALIVVSFLATILCALWWLLIHKDVILGGIKGWWLTTGNSGDSSSDEEMDEKKGKKGKENWY